MHLLLLAAIAQVATPPAKPCKPAVTPADARRPARMQPLSTMPPAKLLYGVYREQGGCPVPIVLRERVGAGPRR